MGYRIVEGVAVHGGADDLIGVLVLGAIGDVVYLAHCRVAEVFVVGIDTNIGVVLLQYVEGVVGAPRAVDIFGVFDVLFIYLSG